MTVRGKPTSACRSTTVGFASSRALRNYPPSRRSSTSSPPPRSLRRNCDHPVLSLKLFMEQTPRRDCFGGNLDSGIQAKHHFRRERVRSASVQEAPGLICPPSSVPVAARRGSAG